MNVPFSRLDLQGRALRDEILRDWEEILLTASFVGGAHVEAFEREFAAACGAPRCVAVGSGTDALRFILLALELKPGDEVVTVPNTFIATTEAITQAGGAPVFVDVLPETGCLDPASLARALTPRTRGIVPVHLYGQTADMDPILSFASAHGLWVVEDACQAHLAEYRGRCAGSLARAAAFSFYPGKNLGACGQAGAATTADPELAERVRRLRDHGQAAKFDHVTEGYNGLLDGVQAAALRAKLKRLPAWTDRRREVAADYARALASCAGITLPREAPGCRHVYHQYVIQAADRDRLRDRLRARGVATGLHYPRPLHFQEAYRGMGKGPGSYPVAERLCERVLSLPIYPELTAAEIAHVTASVREASSPGADR